MKKRILSIALCLLLAVSLLPVTALADEEIIVNNILLEIVAPEPGNHAKAPTVYTGNGSYAVNSAHWYDVGAEKDMTAEDKFYGGKTYEAVLDLIIPGVGRFADANVLSVKVNNKTLTTSYFELHDMNSHLIVTYFFQNLPYPTINTCDVSVIAPEIGAAPSQALTINDEGPYSGYDGGIIWTDENGDTPTVFEGGKTYTVEVRLNADPGAEFAWYNNQPDVGVTLNGQSVSKVEQLGQTYAKAIRFQYTFPTLPGGKPAKIEITTPPNKVAYLEGEPFDPTGVVITATYKDGSTAVLTDDAWEITNNGLDALTPDRTMIHFRLKGTNLIASQPITVTAIPKTTLSAVSLAAEAPAAGAHPNFSLAVNTAGCHVDPSHNTDGFVNGVAWGEMETLSIKAAESAKTLTAADTFSAGKYIVLTFYLEAEKGYTFDSSAAVTVNGREAFFSFGGGSSFVATFVFDPLKAEKSKAITDVALTLTAPKAGEKASFTATVPADADYTVKSVSWFCDEDNAALKDGDAFANGKTYILNATLAAKEGFTFGNDIELKGKLNDGPTQARRLEDGTCLVTKYFTLGLSNPFTDVKESDYFYDAVLWAYFAKPQVTNGMDTTHFGPKSTVTRGQAVTFLWRAVGCPEPETAVNPFVDVPESEYYYKPILWAVEKGITKGTDDTHFTPNQTCSTAHIITFLYRTLGIGADGWYEVAEAWAQGAGLLKGLDIKVAPGVDCPRCDVVLFLYRQFG